MRSIRANHGWSKAPGFTLIELLVVIAIIAILAAVLLPALQSARKRGNASACQGNQRQMGQALMTYMNDMDGFIPYNAAGTRWKAMSYLFPAYKIANTGTPGGVTWKSVFFCPQMYVAPDAAIRKYSYKAETKGRIFYTWLDYAEFWGRSGCVANPKNSKVHNPSKKFLMVEVAQQSNGVGNTRYYWNNKNSFPHNKLSNAIHFDGHSEAYTEHLPAFYPVYSYSSETHGKAAKHWNYAEDFYRHKSGKIYR